MNKVRYFTLFAIITFISPSFGATPPCEPQVQSFSAKICNAIQSIWRKSEQAIEAPVVSITPWKHLPNPAPSLPHGPPAPIDDHETTTERASLKLSFLVNFLNPIYQVPPVRQLGQSADACHTNSIYWCTCSNATYDQRLILSQQLITYVSDMYDIARRHGRDYTNRYIMITSLGSGFLGQEFHFLETLETTGILNHLPGQRIILNVVDPIYTDQSVVAQYYSRLPHHLRAIVPEIYGDSLRALKERFPSVHIQSHGHPEDVEIFLNNILHQDKVFHHILLAVDGTSSPSYQHAFLQIYKTAHSVFGEIGHSFFILNGNQIQFYRKNIGAKTSDLKPENYPYFIQGLEKSARKFDFDEHRKFYLEAAPREFSPEDKTP